MMTTRTMLMEMRKEVIAKTATTTEGKRTKKTTEKATDSEWAIFSLY